jgi:adenylate cyclase
VDGLDDDAALVPVTGTVVFALVAASAPAGQALSLAAAGIAAQRQLLSRAAALVQAPQGRVVERQGDGLLLLFTHTDAAVAWAQASQALCPVVGQHAPGTLALRVGAHHGQMLSDGDALFGHSVNLAARIAAVAGPGETLLSASAQAQASPPWREQMEDLGPYYLKHFDEPQQLFKLPASIPLGMTDTA